MKKSFYRRLLSLLLIAVLFVPAISVQAAGKNVTSSMKKKSGVKHIAKNISMYATSDMAFNHNSKKITLNARNIYSITSVSRYTYSGEYQWSKSQIQKRAYDLFGKKPSLSSIPKFSQIDYKNRCYLARNDSSNASAPYVYAGGDWGDHDPHYKITKIIRVKKNVYDLTVINRLKVWNGSSTETSTVGTTKIRIKKNSKSKYKYVVTKLSYKAK